jgi:hypothetical protein
MIEGKINMKNLSIDSIARSMLMCKMNCFADDPNFKMIGPTLLQVEGNFFGPMQDLSIKAVKGHRQFILAEHGPQAVRSLLQCAHSRAMPCSDILDHDYLWELRTMANFLTLHLANPFEKLLVQHIHPAKALAFLRNASAYK